MWARYVHARGAPLPPRRSHVPCDQTEQTRHTYFISENRELPGPFPSKLGNWHLPVILRLFVLAVGSHAVREVRLQLQACRSPKPDRDPRLNIQNQRNVLLATDAAVRADIQAQHRCWVWPCGAVQAWRFSPKAGVFRCHVRCVMRLEYHLFGSSSCSISHAAHTASIEMLLHFFFSLCCFTSWNRSHKFVFSTILNICASGWTRTRVQYVCPRAAEPGPCASL